MLNICITIWPGVQYRHQYMDIMYPNIDISTISINISHSRPVRPSLRPPHTRRDPSSWPDPNGKWVTSETDDDSMLPSRRGRGMIRGDARVRGNRWRILKVARWSVIWIGTYINSSSLLLIYWNYAMMKYFTQLIKALYSTWSKRSRNLFNILLVES